MNTSIKSLIETNLASNKTEPKTPTHSCSSCWEEMDYRSGVLMDKQTSHSERIERLEQFAVLILEYARLTYGDLQMLYGALLAANRNSNNGHS